MNLNELLHSEADAAADKLNAMASASNDELRAALTNALWRIDLLEKRVESLENMQ